MASRGSEDSRPRPGGVSVGAISHGALKAELLIREASAEPSHSSRENLATDFASSMPPHFTTEAQALLGNPSEASDTLCMSTEAQALLGNEAEASDRHWVRSTETSEARANSEPSAVFLPSSPCLSRSEEPSRSGPRGAHQGAHSHPCGDPDPSGSGSHQGAHGHPSQDPDLPTSCKSAEQSLQQSLHVEGVGAAAKGSPPGRRARVRIRKWIIRGAIAFVVIVGIGLVVTAAGLLAPLIFGKVVLPLMEWEETHLSKPLLGLVAVSCMAFLPLFILPTGPSMWVLGIVFDYFWGFCLIMTGAFFGQSLPFAVGHWLMHDRVQGWLSVHPRLTAVMRLADGGGWGQQFRTTLILRMSPIPYLLFNYAITATKIQYGPYICASMVAMVPETFLAIYCGKLIQKLAIAHGDTAQRRVTPLELGYEIVGLCVSGSVVLIGMYHGQRALRNLEMQEQAQREGQGQRSLSNLEMQEQAHREGRELASHTGVEIAAPAVPPGVGPAAASGQGRGGEGEDGGSDVESGRGGVRGLAMDTAEGEGVEGRGGGLGVGSAEEEVPLRLFSKYEKLDRSSKTSA